MKTFLFAWNPTKQPWKTLKEDIEKIKNGDQVRDGWRIRSHKMVALEDRAFIMRLGAKPKGIVAEGRIVSGPYLGVDNSDSSKMVHRVSIDFDTIIDSNYEPLSDDLLSIDTLNENFGEYNYNWTPQSSGMVIPPAIAEALRSIWFGLPKVTKYYQVGPDDLKGGIDGRPYQANVKRYERNPGLRKVCLDKHGYSCCVCGFDFGQAFGELGKGFIHVHHLEQLSSIGKEHSIDPTKDMRPVCPNCHAMIHRRAEPYSIEEMKKRRVLPF